jgi:hypothetical protein
MKKDRTPKHKRPQARSRQHFQEVANDPGLQLVQERNALLISADEAGLRAYYAKIGVVPPTDPIVFWAAFHKARTSWTGCPLPLRMNSLQWLMAHGMKALDDSQ